MAICDQCKELSKKSNRAKPHEMLRKIDDARIFIGSGSRGYEEQDYQCLECQAKFTVITSYSIHYTKLYDVGGIPAAFLFHKV